MRCDVLTLITVASLAGCGPSGTGADPDNPADAAATPPVASAEMTGQQAYNRVCARCHDEGIDGAPRVGDREAWASRSQLWEAVLFEHAKNGYLAMPARGGDDTLDDAMVEKAAEFMLQQTFPERIPAD